MNWKRLGKLILALALAAAMFASLVPVARAEDSSPRGPITDEVDDSTIINDDGGGTGSGSSDDGNGYGKTRYKWPHGGGLCQHYSWELDRIVWDVSDDGEIKAYAYYKCDRNSCNAEVPLEAEPVSGQPGSYRVTTSKYYSSNYERTTFIIWTVRYEGTTINFDKPYGDQVTDEMSVHHTDHSWILDRFEWSFQRASWDPDKIIYAKADAVFYCRYNRNEKTTVPAEVKDYISGASGCWDGYTATVGTSNYPSPNGRKYSETLEEKNLDCSNYHKWICDGFKWDTSEWDDYVWSGSASFAVQHVPKANLHFHCAHGCGETQTIPAEVRFAGTNGWPVTTLQFQAYVSGYDSPTYWEYWETLTMKHDGHDWIFDGFEWDTTDGVKATAKYHCGNSYCHGHEEVQATVTSGDSGTAIHTYTAVVDATETPDGQAQSETKTFHNLVFQGFEWDLTNFTAKALFECSCGEQHRVDAEMSYPNGNHAKAYVSKYVTPDHTAHEESKEVDFGDYLPYTWEVGAIYEFKGFEWDGYKAYACYDHYKRVGCGTFSKETVKVEAVVTRLSYTVAPQYRARIAAWQTPDGVEHTEVKTIVIPPDPGPIIPRVREDLIGPPREMKPGDWIIGPVAGLNPRNP